MFNPQLKQNDAKQIKLALRKVRFIIESTDKGFMAFFKDNQVDNELLYAISKALEYIGEWLNPEAKFHSLLSNDLVNLYRNIAWKRITHIRNRLEHNYSREIKVVDITNILDDIGILDKQLKGILVSHGAQTDKYFDHKDHNKGAHYKNHTNLLLPPDDFFAVALFDAIKGEDRLTDELRFITIEKNLHLMKIFLNDTNLAVLMKDENRLMREKKIFALERVVEIVGQASKEIDVKIAQKVTEMLMKNNQAQLMSFWIALKAKRDVVAHAEKTPELRKIIKEAEELTILHKLIVAFLAKEYNFKNSNLLTIVTSIVEKHTKGIESFKVELDVEFNNFEKILIDASQPEADMVAKEKEYQQQMQKLSAMRMRYITLHKEINFELKTYVDFLKQVIALHHDEIFNYQLTKFDKILHELDELIKAIQMKIDLSEKTFQAAVHKKQEPKTIEKVSESNLSAKRKQGSTEEKEEVKKAVTPSEVETEKKHKADEKASQTIPSSPRKGL